MNPETETSKSSQPSHAAGPSGRELTISRLFDAPRALVFQAWAEPEHLAHWSGPAGFTVPHYSMDFREGGAFRSCLRAPDGSEHWVRGVYREIVPFDKLVFTHAWEDEQGRPGHQTVVTVRFADQGGKTLMTFHQGEFDSTASRDGHHGGWNSSFDRLAAHLRACVAPH